MKGRNRVLAGIIDSFPVLIEENSIHVDDGNPGRGPEIPAGWITDATMGPGSIAEGSLMAISPRTFAWALTFAAPWN